MRIVLFLLGCMLFQGLYSSETVVTIFPINTITSLKEAFKLVPKYLETKEDVTRISNLVGINPNSLPELLKFSKRSLINLVEEQVSDQNKLDCNSAYDDDATISFDYRLLRGIIYRHVVHKQFVNLFNSVPVHKDELSILMYIDQMINGRNKYLEIEEMDRTMYCLGKHIKDSVRCFTTQTTEDEVGRKRQIIYDYWIKAFNKNIAALFRQSFNSNLNNLRIFNSQDFATYPKPLPLSPEEAYPLYETLLYTIVLWIGIKNGCTVPFINNLKAPYSAVQATHDLLKHIKHPSSYSWKDKKLLILRAYATQETAKNNKKFHFADLPYELVACILSYVEPHTFGDLFGMF